MPIYEIKDLRNIRDVPAPVVLEKPVVLESLNPDNYIPVLWFTNVDDYTKFRSAYMGFDVPEIEHKLSVGGGKVYSYYGNPGVLLEINPNRLLETTQKDRVLHDMLTRASFEVLYNELAKIEIIN